MLTPIPSAFASSNSWVEVARFEGSESGQRKLFTCEYPEWRITWKFTPSHEVIVFKELLKFSITIFAQNVSIDDYESEGQENYFIVNKIDPLLFERSPIEILGDGYITYTVETRRYAESGVSVVNDHVGTFYMSVEASWLVNDYTIIIEQNVHSIPEFPSWIVIPLFLISTLVIAVYRKKAWRQPI
ncbi:MAG: hypothetical protein JW702_04170 [Clostridiales bacterium]|nr:hypothetical protein [Clostridiales bacterium]